MTIVRTTYRYKRPPKKRKAVALEGPTVVTIRDKKRRAATCSEAADDTSKTEAAAPPANAERTIGWRRLGKRYADLEITPEEHKRRGDAADALFRRLVREIAEKNQS